MPEAHDQPGADLPANADESFLDDVFEQALASAERGETLDVESLLAGREHLRAEVEQAERTARAAVGEIQPHEPPPLRVLGYAVERELGRGSMGSVYLARQESLGGRRVALKVLPPSAALSTRARRRFLNEARALARLAHPHVVVVHDVIDSGELVAYAMEWIEGCSLADLLAAQRAASRASLDVAAERLGTDRASLGAPSWTLFVCATGIRIARALAAVHAAGLLHRDVKPSNVLLRRDGTPLLSDFGLVRDEESGRHTQTGHYVGTPAYSSPEQLRGASERIGAPSDVYSLGATLYEALTLHLPHAGRSPAEILARAESGLGVSLCKRDPALPRDLDTVISACLDPDPARRYASAAELADELERVVRLQPIRARPDGILRRASKWARRNRRAVLAGAAAALAAAVPATWAGMRIAGVDRRNERALALVREAQISLLDPSYGWRLYYAVQGDSGRPLTGDLAPRTGSALELYERALALDPSTEIAAAIAGERDCVELATRISAGAAPPTVPATFADACPLSASLASAWDERGEPDPEVLAAASSVDRRHLGLLAFLLGDARLSIAAWTDAAMRLPADGLAHASLGQLYLTLERPELAYACLGLACSAYPEAGYLRGLLADAAIQNGHLDVGERLLAEAESLGLHDPFGTALRVRADLAAARGEDARARELYESLMTHGRTPAGVRHYVRFLEAQGEIEEAIRVHLGSTDGDGAVLTRLAEAWWQSLPPTSTERKLRDLLGHPDRRFGSVFLLMSRVRTSGEPLARGEKTTASVTRGAAGSSPDLATSPFLTLAQRLEVDSMQRTHCSTWPPFLKAALARVWSAPESPRGGLIHGLEAAGLRALGSALVGLGLALPGSAQVVTIADSEFDPSDWSLTIVQSFGSGGNGTASQGTSGGNPGAYRDVFVNVNGASHVQVFHGYAGETFDPAASCGIASVSAFLDAIQLPPFLGAGQGGGMAVRQDGFVYWASSTYFAVPEHAWTAHAFFGLVAEDFAGFMAGSPPHPDFSPSGAPIEVGFMMGDTAPGAPQTTHVGYDNFRFEITPSPAPTSYCTAGTSASGCQALIGSSGTPSASAPSGFSLMASGVEGQKDGLFFFGTSGRQAVSWGNGTSYQCVVPPVKRSPSLGGGTLGGCVGAFSYDLNAHWTSKPAHNPGAGSTVQAQLWYRDPGSTSNQPTSLSDALEFHVCQ